MSVDVRQRNFQGGATGCGWYIVNFEQISIYLP